MRRSISAQRGAGEGPHGQQDERGGEENDHAEAEPCLGSGVARSPDVVQPGAARIDEAVAPYMSTAKATAAPANHAMPEALTWKSAPRSAATPMRTPTCVAHSTSATAGLPSTSSPRGIGAASSSRWAPLSRSTITLRPANAAVSGTRSPTVPTETKAV